MEEKKKRWRPSLTAYRQLEASVNEQASKVKVLESSNGYMEKELKRLRSYIKELESENEKLSFEMARMEKRGFWSRVFNR